MNSSNIHSSKQIYQRTPHCAKEMATIDFIPDLALWRIISFAMGWSLDIQGFSHKYEGSTPSVDEKGAVAFSTASRNLRRCFNASLVLARLKISLKKELISTNYTIPDFYEGRAREEKIDIIECRPKQIFGYLRHHNTATNTAEYEQVTSECEKWLDMHCNDIHKGLHRSSMEGYYPKYDDREW